MVWFGSCVGSDEFLGFLDGGAISGFRNHSLARELF